MKTLQSQKRLAAAVLNVGMTAVKFDSSRLTEIKEAITTQDIAQLVKDGAITKRPVLGNKRRAGKYRDLRKKKGRRRGMGKKKVRVGFRKEDYMDKIRGIRVLLLNQKNLGKISTKVYQKARRLAKSGEIKNKKDLLNYIKTKTSTKE